MPKSPINARLESAVAFHQAGRLDEAERLYDQVIALDRTNADALNLKGVIVNSRGQPSEALKFFDRAIASLPNFPDLRLNRGLALAALGRNEEALQEYMYAIRLKPDFGDARLNFALLLHANGRTEDATSAFRAMTRAVPRDARGFYNLGVCLEKSLPDTHETARPAIADEAKAAFTRALELDPQNPEVHFAFGNLHSFLGEYGLAIERIKSALALNPKWTDEFRAQALSDLGEYLRKERRAAEAIPYHRQAILHSPHNKLIKFNLATALRDNLVPAEAKEIYEDLLRTDPDFPKPYVNLANLYLEENRSDEALSLVEKCLTLAPSFQAYSTMAAAFSDKGWHVTSLMCHDKAVSLKGDDAKSRFNRAVALLNIGHLARGWPDYDRRFEIPAENCPPRPTPPAYWQGEDLTGKTLFVWTEQGIGDEALYASMLPELVGRPQRCIIETSPRLAPVFARSFPQAEVVPRVSLERALEIAAEADVQICTASLGQYLRPDFASFPKHTGYLKADPVKRDRLRRKYEDLARGRRIVGLAWKSKRHIYGSSKSTTPLSLAAILKVPGVMFVNLQYGEVEQDIAEVREVLGVEIYQDAEIDPLTDIDSVFAQVAALDLVISTSNSAAHIAGSLNVPTWVLLPRGRGSFWYWFLRREDSPWYPSVRILRGSGKNPDQSWDAETSARAAADLELLTKPM
ncbi:MAG: tetratricopeptide repeat protein [Rhodospirillaceae bacterium]